MSRLVNIVIDFDGTICEHDFPRIGSPKPGVKAALTRLKELGFTILIHSCRTATYWQQQNQWGLLGSVKEVRRIEAFMEEHEIPYDEIWLPDKKEAAYYVDDRAVSFTDNWPEIVQAIEADSEICLECGQTDMGQSGTDPCGACGLPQMWDRLEDNNS
jgi:hypothetical protein